jgi:hypothetical protein
VARIAAQLNPQLACDDPAKAIELARKLLIAANPELAKQDAERAEEMRWQKEFERRDELFPHRECISVAEAFKASPGQYKTETKFAAALRKQSLITIVQHVNFLEWQKASPDKEEKFAEDSEVTSIRAVDELFRRQREAKKKRDRERKSAKSKKPPNTILKKTSRNFERPMRNSGVKRRSSNDKKRKRQSEKRKPQKARQSH